MKGYFYVTKNLINGKFYYGSSTAGNEQTYLGSSKILEKSIKKYGRQNFEHIPLKYFRTREEAFIFEDRFLKLYKIAQNPMSYNQKNAGKGGRTWQDFPDEIRKITLRKISDKAKIAHKISDKMKANVGKLGKMKTLGRTGKILSRDIIERIRNTNIETWKNPSLKKKQSDKAKELNALGIIGMKGKKHKPESIEKIRKSNTGKSQSLEMRQIISEKTKEAMLNMCPKKREELTQKANSNRAKNMELRKERLKAIILDNSNSDMEEIFKIAGYPHKTFLGLINKIKLEDEKIIKF